MENLEHELLAHRIVLEAVKAVCRPLV